VGTPVDHRCDIYSLGVVLYELVTGRVPFKAETPLAVVLKHVNDPLPLPRRIRPDLSAAVERVILKAMAKAPNDRFQSAGEMVDALEEAVAAAPTDSAPQRLRAEAAEATTLASGVSLPSLPVVEQAPPSPAVDKASTRPEGMMPVRWRQFWPLFVGGAVLLGLLLVIGQRLMPNLSDGESTPTVVSQAQLATPTPESQPATSLPSAVSEPVRLPSGWTNYGNANFVFALARQRDTLWAGGESGLVGWDLTDGSHTRIGRADGLASGRVNDVLAGGEGVLWIATDAGINRYDGKTMMTYDEDDGLDASYIQALFLDGAGGLWAGSHGGERGLNYYDGEGWGPPPIPPLPVEGPNVRVLGGSEEEGLRFVGLEGQGLALFDGEAWNVLTTANGLPSDEVLGALLTDDALWVSFDVAVVRFDLETDDRQVIPQASIHAIHQTADGELWYGGEWRAIRFDPGTADWEEFDTTPGPIPGWLVTDILGDMEGLWFGTYGGGVALYHEGRWETWTVDDRLGGNQVYAILQDRDGAIWFTHPGTGLSRYEPEGDAWQVFGQAAGAVDWPAVPDVDSDGNLWTGEYGELVRYDGQGWQRFPAPELTDVTIDAIEFGPGDVQWIATDSGLMRHDPATDEWTTFTGADHPIIENIWSFLVSRDGTVWVGGEEGLVQYDGNTWSTPAASGSAPRFVDDLAEAPDGSLWAAADGELVHLASGRWSQYTWPSYGWVETVAIGPDGTAWVGYEGLGRFDPGGGGWLILTPTDGLVHMTVRAIYVTPEGVVWIGTEGGVSRYVPPS